MILCIFFLLEPTRREGLCETARPTEQGLITEIFGDIFSRAIFPGRKLPIAARSATHDSLCFKSKIPEYYQPLYRASGRDLPGGESPRTATLLRPGNQVPPSGTGGYIGH